MRKARPRQAGLALVNDLSEATFSDFLQKLAKVRPVLVLGAAAIEVRSEWPHLAKH